MSYDYEDECEQVETKPTDLSALPVAIASLLENYKSDFSAEVMQRAVSKCIDEVSDALSTSLFKTINELLLEQIKRQAGALIEQSIKDEMPKLLASVLTTEIVVTTGSSWSQKKSSVVDVVKEQLDEFLRKLGNRDDRATVVKDCVKEYLAKDLSKTVQDAVLEFKKETFAGLKTEVSKELVGLIAKSIASDGNLLKLLEIQKAII